MGGMGGLVGLVKSSYLGPPLLRPPQWGQIWITVYIKNLGICNLWLQHGINLAQSCASFVALGNTVMVESEKKLQNLKELFYNSVLHFLRFRSFEWNWLNKINCENSKIIKNHLKTAKMVVLRGLLRERQFISAPIKIICPRRSRGLMIVFPARRSRAKVKCIAHERSECRQGIYWHE